MGSTMFSERTQTPKSNLPAQKTHTAHTDTHTHTHNHTCRADDGFSGRRVFRGRVSAVGFPFLYRFEMVAFIQRYFVSLNFGTLREASAGVCQEPTGNSVLAVVPRLAESEGRYIGYQIQVKAKQ
jgi:hypothetical protein